MKLDRRAAAALVVFLLLVGGLTWFGAYNTGQGIRRSEQKWCTAIGVLVEADAAQRGGPAPVPGGYGERLAAAIAKLEREFDCPAR